MDEKEQTRGKMAVFVGIGFELIGLLLGAAFLGRYLDEKFALKGLMTAGLVILALVGWLIHLVVLLKGFQADTPVEK